MSKKENALAAIAAAVKQAELSYEFAPGSYTPPPWSPCAPPRRSSPSIWRGQHE